VEVKGENWKLTESFQGLLGTLPNHVTPHQKFIALRKSDNVLARSCRWFWCDYFATTGEEMLDILRSIVEELSLMVGQEVLECSLWLGHQMTR
jgi:hypothetical protein